MRLLNTETLRMEEFFEANLPPYAILSHTWEKEEVLLPDMADLAKARQKAGFAKIKGACALARRQQYEYIWIDTCCIDKSSSAELSEAINSMYRWYQESDVCYAYLCDVVLGEDLTTSRWFTRGWTLQELIAPGAVEFYSGAWELIGTENDEAIMDAVSRVTGIDPGILSGWLELSEVSIAQKMSWASKRVTTRPEDEAYCLMGLFDVNMPLIYGEGSRAFRRLQEEIVTRCPYDQSILAWYSLSDDDYLTGSLLAHSPKVFEKSGGIFPIPRRQSKGGPETAITLTSQWMDLSGLIFTMSTSDDGPGSQRPDTCCFGQYLQPWPPTDMTPSDLLATDAVVAILDCQLGTVPGTYPALFLQRSGNGSYSRLLWTGQGVVRFSLHDSASLSDDRSMLGISPFRASREKPLLFNNSRNCRCQCVFEQIRLGMRNTELLPSWHSAFKLLRQMNNTASGRPDQLRFEYYKYWLVPVPPKAQQLELTVSGVFPKTFVRGSLHHLSLTELCESNNGGWLRSKSSHIDGIAGIRLSRLTNTVGAPDKTDKLGQAVVRFGTRSLDCKEELWCHVAAYDGVHGLRQLFDMGPEMCEPLATKSSLTLESGFVLRASAQADVDVSGVKYKLIRVWVEPASDHSEETGV